MAVDPAARLSPPRRRGQTPGLRGRRAGFLPRLGRLGRRDRALHGHRAVDVRPARRERRRERRRRCRPAPLCPGLAGGRARDDALLPSRHGSRRVQLGVASAAAASSSFSSASAAAASSSSGVAAAVRQGKLIATALALAREEGVPALYRGFVPSCLKNLPNKGVKLSVFDGAKRALAASEAALAEERARVAGERERRRRRRRGQRKNGLGGLWRGCSAAAPRRKRRFCTE